MPEVTVAMAPLDDVQRPPAGVAVSVVVEPVHTVAVPPITPGLADTVITLVAEQPATV